MTAMKRIVVACLLAFAMPASAAPPDPTSEQFRLLNPHRGWVEEAKNREGHLCCSMADGAVVQARIFGGRWQVRFYPDRRFSAPPGWLDVEERALVTTPNPTGLPVAWFLNGTVRCFSPPAGG